MRGGLPGPQRGTGTEMHEKTLDTDAPLLSGETRELREPGWDEFSRTKEERAEMGVRDNEVITYVRNPSYWQTYEHKNRVREFKAETPGGRILTDANANYFEHGDTLVAAMPRDIWEAREAQRRQETKDFDRATENPEQTEFDEVPRFKIEPGQYGPAAQQQHYQNISAGLIGGQYAGLPVDVVIKQIGKERYEADQAKYRNGGRHRVDVNRQDQGERIQAAREMVTSSNKSGSVISIPPGVKPRNTMAAAAQRRG